MNYNTLIYYIRIVFTLRDTLVLKNSTGLTSGPILENTSDLAFSEQGDVAIIMSALTSNSFVVKNSTLAKTSPQIPISKTLH